MNNQRAFISEHLDKRDSRNCFTILEGDYRYFNEPIIKDVDINNCTIINRNKKTNDNDVYTIRKHYSLLQ